MISASGRQTIGPASGGKVFPFNAITSANNTTVVAANAQRAKLTFANPGTITIYVSPLRDANNAVLTPTTAALGGTFPIFGGGVLTLEGEIQGAWQALAASGTTNPFTVSDSNV